MNEKLGITTIATLFGLTSAVGYLTSYWGAFDIDVFQLAGLTDFAKLAIFPMAISYLASATGLCLSLYGPVAWGYRLGVRSASSPVGARIWPLYWRFAPAVLILGSIALAGAIDGAWKWGPIAIVSSVAVFTACLHPLATAHRQRYPYVPFLLSVVVAQIFLFVLIGAGQSAAVKQGKAKRTVDNIGIGASLANDPGHPLMYVGFVADTFVIYETKTGSVVLVKQSDSAPLVLKPNPNYHEDLRSQMTLLGL